MINRVLIILIAFIELINSQIAPQWLNSPYMQSKLISIPNDVNKTANTYYYPAYYSLSFTNPTVLLAINKMVSVSNNSDLGFRYTISTLSSTGFTSKIQIFGSTIVSALQIRFLAYQYTQLGSDISLYFLNTSNSVDNSIGEDPAVDYSLTYSGGATLPVANDVQCVAFLTGVTANSNDNYQVNISCLKQTDTSFRYYLKLATGITLNTYTIYFLIIDNTNLAVASKHFVDYGVTQAKNGVQYTFFNPIYGIKTNGYLSGLRSFSIRDNYQFNYTISNTLFYVYQSSYYDDTSNFNFRVRLCTPSPYTYYSKVDGLCHNQCPDGTYKVQANLACQPCHYTCATCADAISCITCNVNRIKDATNLCPCISYFYQSNKVCIACHYSCQTCSTSQYFDCLTCQAAKFRQKTAATAVAPCPCMSGYQDVGVTQCAAVCGDGIILNDQCDDGNTIDGDGCSSTCMIQANFTCNLQPSQCFYIGIVTLEIAKIQKDPFSNTAKFYVKMTPYIDLMARLAGTSSITTNLSFITTSVTSQSPYLVYTGVFTKDIQGSGAIVFLTPTASGPFSQIPKVNATFLASSTNSLLLKIYNTQQYNSAMSMETACFVIGYIIIISSIIFSCTSWKLIGTQTYFIIQFMFMSITMVFNFTPTLSALGGFHNIMGYNGLLGQTEVQYSKRPNIFQMGYSIPYQYNVNFMLIPQGLALIMYIVYKIVQKVNDRRMKSGHDNIMQNWCGKIISVFKFQFFAYWTFINTNQFLFATVLQTESTLYLGAWALAVFCLASIIVSVIIVTVSSKNMSSYRIKPFHRTYGGQTFLLQLLGLAILNVSLLLGVRIMSYLFYLAFVVPIFFIIFAALRRPFESKLNLARFITNYSFLALSLILVTVMINDSSSNTLYVPVGIMLCIILTFLVNLVIYIILMVRGYFVDQRQLKSQSHDEQLKQIRKKMKDQQMSKIKLSTAKKPLMDLMETQRGYTPRTQRRR